jgi:hypothetical protein
MKHPDARLLLKPTKEIGRKTGAREDCMSEQNSNLVLGMSDGDFCGFSENGWIDGPTTLIPGDEVNTGTVAEQSEAIAAEKGRYGT